MFGVFLEVGELPARGQRCSCEQDGQISVFGVWQLLLVDAHGKRCLQMFRREIERFGFNVATLEELNLGPGCRGGTTPVHVQDPMLGRRAVREASYWRQWLRHGFFSRLALRQRQTDVSVAHEGRFKNVRLVGPAISQRDQQRLHQRLRQLVGRRVVLHLSSLDSPTVEGNRPHGRLHRRRGDLRAVHVQLG